ncbi:MAG: cation:proton antiporter, partial [Burkholderiales bacterium]|nr:cation:proton antiporter [Burkholderiales bacterium]
IASLFVFAGLEVEPADFRRGGWPLIGHVVLRLASLAGVTWFAMRYADLGWQAGALLALALLTPSTGFILENLPSLDLDESERFWVRLKAISSELLALGLLFVVLQSGSGWQLLGSSAALAAMMLGLPILFIGLGRWVIPHARGSEFSLLVMVGVVASTLSYKLGVYYLVGAFLTGVVARSLRRRMPSLASDENLHAIRMFASFFVPFYFFHAGMGVPGGALTLKALAAGLALSLVFLPARIAMVWAQRRFIAGESARASLNVAVALLPTLIFTLVLATILRERFQIPDWLYGALLVYAVSSTLLPSLALRRAFGIEMPAATAPDQSGRRASQSDASVS